MKKQEREKKKQEREKKKDEREKKKKKREKKEDRKKEPRKRLAKARDKIKSAGASVTELEDPFSNLTINESEGSGDESEAECPGCGLVYGCADGNERWVLCDVCEAWWDMTCAGVDKKKHCRLYICLC